jgi:hypothetical protein
MIGIRAMEASHTEMSVFDGVCAIGMQISSLNLRATLVKQKSKVDENESRKEYESTARRGPAAFQCMYIPSSLLADAALPPFGCSSYLLSAP